MMAHKVGAPLRILAFSDYRIHSFAPLLDFVNGTKRHIDFIAYAGDDVRRFGPVPSGSIELPTARGENEDLETTMVADAAIGSAQDSVFGWTLSLPEPCDVASAREVLRETSEGVAKLESLIDGKPRTMPEWVGIVDSIPTFGLTKTRGGLPKVITRRTNSTVLVFEKLEDGTYLPFDEGGYMAFGNSFGADSLKELSIRKIGGDKRRAFFHIAREETSTNLFPVLAKMAKHGIGGVIGNDDHMVVRLWISGPNVYELHTRSIRIGRYLIAGLEGSTCGMGWSGVHTEAYFKSKLAGVRKQLKRNDRLVIVSHSPPRGVLDRAMRFGDRPIGSTALREFIEQEDRVKLVICGHVHGRGGSSESLGQATVVNVASHDDVFTHANLAWITIDGDEVAVEFDRLPSLLQYLLSEGASPKDLGRKAYLKESEANLIHDFYQREGNRFSDRIEDLARMKYLYGLSWKLTLKAFRKGVSNADEMTDAIYETLRLEATGFDHLVLRSSHAKFRRERDRGTGKTYLMYPLPEAVKRRPVVFDTEYTPEQGVLFGFQEVDSGEFRQFWFDQLDEAREYARSKEQCTFIHWGGNDRGLLQSMLNSNSRTFNLLYHVQISLVAPIQSASLRDVHDVLCGRAAGKWWEESFYTMDGLEKLALCEKALDNPKDHAVRKLLAKANQADVRALDLVLKRLWQLGPQTPT